MALIGLQEVSLGFGGPLLFDGIQFQIEPGERIGLLGRNGMGKSTLLKTILGEHIPDGGSVSRQQNVRLAYLPQEVPGNLAGTISRIVAAGLEQNSMVAADHGDTWKEQVQVEQVISRMQLDPKAQFEDLSAGLKRRALLARGLVTNPDLLLLDEPTNHLDLNSITWLENFLLRWGGTLLFVTHDRVFLQKLSTRIVELDRGRLFDWNCSYSTFIKRKEAMLAAETEQNENFDKKLAQEESWIRQGIEARRTRNEGRVRALKRLREIRLERREQPGSVQMQIQEDRRTGRLVIECEKVFFGYGNRAIIKDFSTTISRGDKVGIIGPNGSGKTTLLRLLMGELLPRQGEVRHGTNLVFSYFDQLRAQLNEDQSVLENVGQGSDTVMINGKQRNIVGYLEGFLFNRERVHTPIGTLSGGERNRLLLARLFARPANVLIMDEPTNDLDIETLELLEDMLLDYSGTLLLVSHDRAFLNNLVTSTLVLDQKGTVREYVGGYDDWQVQSLGEKAMEAAGIPRNPGVNSRRDEKAAAAVQKKQEQKERREVEIRKREIASMPGIIEALEAEQHELSRAMAQPEFYQQDPAEISRAASRLKHLEEEMVRIYQKWEELEQLP